VGDDRLLIKRLHAQAEMIHVAPFPAGRRAAGPAERAADFHEVDHGVAHAQMRHAELGSIGDVARAEHLAVELTHALDVAYAQHDVIDATDRQHAVRILPELRG
jgi:hypothetical protein